VLYLFQKVLLPSVRLSTGVFQLQSIPMMHSASRAIKARRVAYLQPGYNHPQFDVFSKCKSRQDTIYTRTEPYVL